MYNNILPSIRKYGGYAITEKISRVDLAKIVIEVEEEKKRLILQTELQKNELQKQAPKVQYFDEVL